MPRTIIWFRLIQDPARTVRKNRLREYALFGLADEEHLLYHVEAPTDPLPANWTTRILPSSRQPLRRLALVLRDLLTARYDLVLTYMLGSKETVCTVVANLVRGKPFVVVTEHWYRRRGWLREAWFKLVLRRARLAVAQSTRSERFLRELGAPRVIRCVNTISDISSKPYDEDLVRQLRDAPGPRIVCVARFVEFKGQDLLVRAFRDIENPDARLYLVGNDDSQFGRHCRELARADRRIAFAGRCDFARVLAYYRACDLFVLANRFTNHRIEGAESFGYAPLEAAYLGLPLVLSTATGCADDLIVDGVTGYTLPAGDLAALRACLERLLAQPDRLPRLGAAARAHARELCQSTATADLRTALDSILASLPVNGSAARVGAMT